MEEVYKQDVNEFSVLESLLARYSMECREDGIYDKYRRGTHTKIKS